MKLRQLNALLNPGVPPVDVREDVANRLARAMPQEVEMDDSDPELEPPSETHIVGGVEFIDENQPGRFFTIEFDPDVACPHKKRRDS